MKIVVKAGIVVRSKFTGKISTSFFLDVEQNKRIPIVSNNLIRRLIKRHNFYSQNQEKLILTNLVPKLIKRLGNKVTRLLCQMMSSRQ